MFYSITSSCRIRALPILLIVLPLPLLAQTTTASSPADAFQTSVIAHGGSTALNGVSAILIEGNGIRNFDRHPPDFDIDPQR